MEFKTSISKMTADDHVIRGEKLSALIADSSFSDAIYLLIKGEKPTKVNSIVFNALLVSSIDHGMGTASAQTARTSAASGNSVNTAVAAGILGLGSYHGGAIEQAMTQLKQVKNVAEFVKANLANKVTMYGFGHKVYKDSDPRVAQVLGVCHKAKFTSPYIDLVLEIEKEIEQQKGKKIVLNVDGLTAAILLEMGFTPNQGWGVFIIARTPGLVAQVIEELESGEHVRRIDESEITYHGK